ncbi:MAG TPA: type II toxin-antitoxin system Phd/YefM family antitoxin [Deltaproteobacteria bacterium]|nr:type II toxin-antitoxin system Phd/YefM family antitoxin [Deltaproteobacteria bacterium]
MKKLSISQDIVPVGEFKTGISKFLKSLNETGHHLVITQNGRPAGVILTPSEYDKLTYQNPFVKSVNQGQQDIESGEYHTTDEVKEKIKSARNSRNTQ